MPFGQFEKGPLWVPTCLGCCLDVWQFLLFSLWLEATFWSQSFNVRIAPSLCSSRWCESNKKYWFVCVCGVQVDLDAEVTTLTKRCCTIQEAQTINLRSLPGELYVLVHCIYFSSMEKGFTKLMAITHPVSDNIFVRGFACVCAISWDINSSIFLN